MGVVVDVEDRLFKIWNFEWPTMTFQQFESQAHFLEELLEDIEDNPEKYEFNRVKLVVDSEDPSDLKTEVCILPRRAFRGHVEDVIVKFHLKLFECMARSRL